MGRTKGSKNKTETKVETRNQVEDSAVQDEVSSEKQSGIRQGKKPKFGRES